MLRSSSRSCLTKTTLSGLVAVVFARLNGAPLSGALLSGMMCACGYLAIFFYNKSLGLKQEALASAKEARTKEVTKIIVQKLYEASRARVDELEAELNDLRDKVQDLEVTAAKVSQQAVVIKKLQERNERLNHIINFGREKRSSTTLGDVYKLTGEGGMKSQEPEPTFPELNQQLEDANDD